MWWEVFVGVVYNVVVGMVVVNEVYEYGGER